MFTDRTYYQDVYSLYRLNAITIKISASYSVDTKVYMKAQKIQNNQHNVKEEV